MQFFYEIPGWLAAVIMAATVAILAVAGHVVVQRRVRSAHLAEHNDIVGPVITVVGTLYAVVLAFVVITVWEAFDHAGSVAQLEIDSLDDLYHAVAVWPPADRERIRGDILAYTRLMVLQEWPAMQRGGGSDRARTRAERIIFDVYALKKGTVTDADLGHELALLQRFFDMRRQRLASNNSSIPFMLWWTLWAGAAAVMGLTYLFGTNHRGVQLIVTAILAGTIGLLMALLIELEYPFRGEVSIPPTGWITLEHYLTSGFVKN